MKKTLLLLLTILIQIYMEAQNNIIPNFNLEKAQPQKYPQCDYTTILNGIDFDIENWRVAQHNNGKGSSSPDWVETSCSTNGLCSDADYPNGYNSRQLLIKADVYKCKNNFKNTHEAVCVSLENNGTFTQGMNYILRYKVAPSKAVILSEANYITSQTLNDCKADLGNCHLRIFLSELGNIGWNKNNSDKQELISANFQATAPDPLYCHYSIQERKFTANKSNFTTLVFYAESGGILFDDVEVFEECQNSYLIQNKSYAPPFYLPNSVNGISNFTEKSSDNITAGKNITSNKPTGDVTINAHYLSYSNPQFFKQKSAHVRYTAANEINLRDGFTVEHGADFAAVILPCPNNFNRLINPNTNPDPNYIIPAPLITDEDIVSDDEQTNEIFNISIFPNPNNGQFNIQLSESEELPTSISIQNILSQVILTRDVTSNNTQVDLNEAPKGIYMVLINYKEYTITKKIIKE